MKTHELIQGTPEWNAHRATHFNASDAPAMMGASPYKTRSQLLQELSTGIVPEVDAATQRRFDDGHRYEALARPLAEKIIGEELYPVVGSEGKLSASFDGLTMLEDDGFEHKSLNDELRAIMVEGCTGADLPPLYRIQMEQQCMVSGAGRILFMASQWNGEELVEERHCWYEPDPQLRNQITAGWAQFAEDLANYQHVEHAPAAVAAPVMALPALSIQVNGSISLVDNLKVFGEKLTAFIDGLDKNPSDDQAFANAEAAVKTLQAAQDALEAAEAGALAQTAGIDEMRRTVALYADQARTTRLMLTKLVASRKEAIRGEIVAAGRAALSGHILDLNKQLGKPYMPQIPENFAGVIKGKKTVASLHDSCDTELARLKIEANAIAGRIQINLNTLQELASDHKFLFADTGQIVLKANDDLTALVKLRIAEHEAAEQKRLDAEREKIRAEEQAKAEAEAKAKADAEAKAKETAAAQAPKPADPGRGDGEHPATTPAPAAAPLPPKEVVKAAIPTQGGTDRLRALIMTAINDLTPGEMQQALDAIRAIQDARPKRKSA